jgi:dolichol-phosphate mannosyltransferase
MYTWSHSDPTLRRWVVFNLIGVTGVLVQLVALTGFLAWGVHYLMATALAVEAAVLNNFVWHQRWTWRDRPPDPAVGTFARLTRFNLTVGVVSIMQNVVFMKLMVGYFAMHYLTGNLISIAVCSLLNFLLSDHLVFRPVRTACVE